MMVLAVDGNSVLHRAHHAWASQGSDDRDSAGRPIWGLRGLVIAVAAAAARLQPEALVVGFDCTEHSERREVFEGYKAHRPEKPLDLADELDRAPELLRDAGFAVVTQRGCEADDVLATVARAATCQGWHSTLMTSDRDSFALIDEHTSVLRVVNGGIHDSPLLGPDDVRAAYGVDPGQYRDFAALRGDPSDNLAGALGVGPKYAALLLQRFGSLPALFDAVSGPAASESIAEVAALTSSAVAASLADPRQRAVVIRTAELMRMRTDLTLPDWSSMQLPLDGRRVRHALHQKGIRLTSALWAVVGEAPPPWSPHGFDRAPAYLPGTGEPPPWALSNWIPVPDWTARDPDPDQSPASSSEPAPRRPARRGATQIVLDGQLSLF